MIGAGKRENTEKTRKPVASPGTMPTSENLGVTRPGIEPDSPWWEASRLTAQPLRHLCRWDWAERINFLYQNARRYCEILLRYYVKNGIYYVVKFSRRKKRPHLGGDRNSALGICIIRAAGDEACRRRQGIVRGNQLPPFWEHWTTRVVAWRETGMCCRELPAIGPRRACVWGSAGMQEREGGDGEKTRRPAGSYGTIPACENPGASPPGIEPGSSWWPQESMDQHINVILIMVGKSDTSLVTLSGTSRRDQVCSWPPCVPRPVRNRLSGQAPTLPLTWVVTKAEKRLSWR
ncbi:hypothetical protein PR048_014635 [Dryococelus australis]|uniref:Uncharacterized protein n=1 Tax=Dryococelus australis TaxID=614101 RepID=A0ABQ9HER6_9NEOP|nr:hypothetical protein PR048_014635 [Dryococelus australis]